VALPPGTHSEGSKEADGELLRHKSHYGAGICFLNNFWSGILSPLSKATGEEGMLMYLAFSAGGKEVIKALPVKDLCSMGADLAQNQSWGCVLGEGGQAERSLVSVLSGWLGYCHDLTAPGCQTVLK